MTASSPPRADVRQMDHQGDRTGEPLHDFAQPDGGRSSRFGAAADMVDRLDLRPLALRRHRRPWWQFW